MINKIIYFLFVLFSIQVCSKKSNKHITYDDLKISYPFEGTIYPKNFRSPIFLWETKNKIKSDWEITVRTSSEEYKFKSKINSWHIPFKEWEKIRDSSINKNVLVVISGNINNELTLTRKVTFSISNHKIEGDILYREVPVPFEFAVSHFHLVKYNIASLLSNNLPKTVIKPYDDKIYSCLSCHSLSRDSKKLAIISKYPDDSILIANIDSKSNIVKNESVLRSKDIVRLAVENSKSDNRDLPPGHYASPKISPDGKYIVLGIHAIFANYFSSHQINQPFSINILQSNLGIYSIEERRLWLLPGTDSSGYIYSTPTWSPDGKFITYAFAKHPPDAVDSIKYISIPNLSQLDPLKHYFMPEGLEFDLYTIPFNNGKGGVPKAIKATVKNGLFDYFPEYSPDGKWIVYTSSKLGTNIFLNPDSTLYIVSTENNIAAKKLSSNFKGVMNSWHKFSLDGNWLLFTARPNGVDTKLFLTHIDRDGKDSPPILIDSLTRNNRYRVNLPVFTTIDPESTIYIRADGFCNARKILYEDNFFRCVFCHSFNPYYE